MVGFGAIYGFIESGAAFVADADFVSRDCRFSRLLGYPRTWLKRPGWGWFSAFWLRDGSGSPCAGFAFCPGPGLLDRAASAAAV